MQVGEGENDDARVEEMGDETFLLLVKYLDCLGEHLMGKALLIVGRRKWTSRTEITTTLDGKIVSTAILLFSFSEEPPDIDSPQFPARSVSSYPDIDSNL